MDILNFLSINNTFFTLLDYQMSYLEFFGTIFTIWSVWLTVKAKALSWPIGIIGIILYIFLFYQIQLYSDLFEQGYFLITGFFGWWLWLHPKTKNAENKDRELKITSNNFQENLFWIGAVAMGTAILTYVTMNLSVWLPRFFPIPASFVFLDALTTAMSFAAQWLLAKKKLESWVLWIIVDFIAVPLYYFKGIKFVALEYLLFLILATKGLIDWMKEYKNYQKNN